MVKKRDGTICFCNNDRRTNQLIMKDTFPLPKIDTCLDTLNGSAMIFVLADSDW